MPRKPGPGRYLLAAFLLALEAPVVFVLAVGAALSRVLLAVSCAAQALTRLSAALRAGDARGRQSSDAARAVTRLGHRG